MEIELITKRFEVYPECIRSSSRTINLPEKPTILYFVDSFNSSFYQEITYLNKFDINVLVVTTQKPKFTSFNCVYYVTVSSLWYIHTLFLDPFVFKFVKGLGGSKSLKLAEAFSQFTGFSIPLNPSLELIKSINWDAVLIKTYDGIGDLLMCTPTAREYFSKGFKVDFLVYDGRDQVLYNIPYINKVYTNKDKVDVWKYRYFYDVSFKLSNYRGDKRCRQHRVLATANLCGLEKVASIKPDIFLTVDEINKGKRLLSKLSQKKLLVSFDSFALNRSYPIDLRGRLLNTLLQYFDVILVGYYKNGTYLCSLDLRGRTTIRELFSVVYNSDLVLTVDTSVLHIAAAFNKPTVFMPSTIYHKWRTYTHVKTVVPEVSCYPCNEACNRMCQVKKDSQYCFRTIPQSKIIQNLISFQ